MMRKNWLLSFVGALAILALSATHPPVQAQTAGTVAVCFGAPTACQRVTLANPLPVNASVSASIAGFPTDQTTGTPISVTTGGVAGTLPVGAVVVATNVGTTNAAYCKLGASATTSDQYIAPSGGWFAFTVGSATQLTCITSTSTTTVNMVGGSGLPTGTGGGGGGGSGGAVTQSGTWTVQPGNTANTTAWLVTGTGGTFPVTQATAASLNATVVGTGTFAVQAASTLAAETTKVIGTVRNLGNAGAAFDAATGAAVPANGLYVGMSQAGNLTGLTGTSGNLNVQCANCSGSGVSTADEAAFTAGSSLFAGSGGFFQTTATNNALTTGQQGMLQMTATRAAFTNCRNAAGAECGVAAVPFQVSIANTGANATAMLVTGTGGTFPVTATNLSTNVSQINGVTVLMGNGATGTGSQRVTIANDNTLPTGWASSVAIASTTAGQTGPLSQCAVTTAAPTYTTAQTDPLSCDTAGGLRVNTGTVTVTATNLSTNIAQINGVTPLMGNGASGTGSQRVNLVTDGTAISTTGFMSVKVDQTTPGTTNAVALAQINAATTLAGNGASGTGSQRVNIANDNTLPTGWASSVAIASTTAGQTGPLSQCAVTTAAPTYTTAQTDPLSCDTTGNLRVTLGGGTFPTMGASVLATGTGWTSATGGNSTQTLISTYAAPAILVQLDQTTTITGGVVTFEGTYDGTNWVTIPVAQVIDPNTLAPLTNPYTLQASTNKPFLILAQGYQSIRVRLSTVITGSGTVTPFTANLSYNPTLGALLNPLAAGSAIIGKVGIDQTTPGTTNAVQAISGTTGGASTTGNIAANNTTAVVVKASAGTLYGVQVYGIGSAPAYLKIYNATSATCGSGTPVKRLMIPAAATAANGAGSNISFGDVGVAFGTGITYCVTTGITDADTTAPAASTFLVNLDWK